MPIDGVASYVAADDPDDVGGDDAPKTEDAEKRRLGKALIAAIKSGDGMAVCEAVKAIQGEEPY